MERSFPMDPQTGYTSGTPSRRVKYIKNVSGRHQTGRCWKESHHHHIGLLRQVHSHHHRMTGLSYGRILYQTGLHLLCRFQPERGSQHSQWFHVWWTLHLLKPSPRRTRRIPRFFDPLLKLPRQGRTFDYSCINLSNHIFHLLNAFLVLMLCPALTDSSAVFPQFPPRTGLKTFILLCEVRRSRLQYSEVSDCSTDFDETKMIMYKRTIMVYDRSRRFLFIRRNVASANCKCIIPKAPLAAPTLIMCDS